jgi:hypothetical protein
MVDRSGEMRRCRMKNGYHGRVVLECTCSIGVVSAGRVAFLLPLIFSFRIRVERIEGVTKLNQTHPPGDRMRVATALQSTPEGAALAQLMLDSDL